MLLIAEGVTSISVDGIEYKVEEGLVEVPNEAYKKIVYYQGVRAARQEEIAALERIAEQKAAESAAKQAEEKAKKEAAAKKAAENGGK